MVQGPGFRDSGGGVPLVSHVERHGGEACGMLALQLHQTRCLRTSKSACLTTLVVCFVVPRGGLRGFRPPQNPLVVGAILSFETALKLIALCKLAFYERVVLHRVGLDDLYGGDGVLMLC